MPLSAKGFADVLLGTSSNRRVRVLLHVAFWLSTYYWVYFQSVWIVGSEHPAAVRLIAVSKLLSDFSAFYLISYAVRRVQSVWWALLLTGLLLVGTFISYGVVSYYLYRHILATVPALPVYFHNIVKSFSKEGLWTFLKDYNGLYFHLIQLSFGLGLPLVVKVLRWAVQKRLRVLALEKDNLQLELEFLRAQINPHFFFNTLNSVYSLVEDKDQTAAALVLSLSNMMRYALYDSATPEVDVAQELAFIQEYLDIQQIRHQRRLKIDVEIAPDLGSQRIPPMLLVTFLENAVKHGVDKLLRHAWVRVRAYRDETDTFCFTVTNAVPPPASPAPSEGIGLRNTRRRLSILYPTTHSLQTSATATQYHVLLRLWQ